MVRMIGAMPAVAVRQQRKHVKHDDHKHRPNTLTIEATHAYAGLPTPLRSPKASPRNSPHESPVGTPPKHSPASPPKAHHKKSGGQGCGNRCVHGYLCGRISLLHVSVVCVLLGITLLVVGLVQLAPGAAEVTEVGLPPTGSDVNKYAIIGSGTGFLGLGFLFLILLCTCQNKGHRRRRPPPHLIQAHPGSKGRSGSGKSNSKGHSKGHSKHMQVHTVEGAVAATSGTQDLEDTTQNVELRHINEKEMSLEGFVKSPSESDALIQSCSGRRQ